MRYLTLFFILFANLHSFSQTREIDSLLNELKRQADDSNKVRTLWNLARAHRSVDRDKLVEYANQAVALADQVGAYSGKGQAIKFKALSYSDRSDYAAAIRLYEEARKAFEQANDTIGISNVLSNTGAVYVYLGDNTKGLEFFYESLKLAEKMGDKRRILSALNNIGTGYLNNPNTKDRALDYYKRALALAKEIDDQPSVAVANNNIGEIYFSQGKDSALNYFFEAVEKLEALNILTNVPGTYNNIGKLYLSKQEYNKAIFYHSKALDVARKLGDKRNKTATLNCLAKVYLAQGDKRNALNTYLEVVSIAGMDAEIGGKLKYELKDAYEGLSDTYSQLGDFRNAFKYNNLLGDIKDSLVSIEATDKMKDLGRNYELDKIQTEVQFLKVDQELKEEQLRRGKIVRNAILAGLALVLLLIGILYRDYKNKIRTNKLLDQRKAEIEALLLNILPFEVAAELQKTGHSAPRYYESTTVMFTDFVGFSRIAETLTPQQITAELNEFFTEMDEIIERYNLEKIKTIGDSYMCAGGIPSPNKSHPEDAVRAGLDIVEYLRVKNKAREDAGMPKWEIRIGINTGSLVAGVVGKKKYAYDIWGSAVNIASRMESNGQPGLLNISQSTYEMVKDKFNCEHRGKIYAKNVGEIDMYFVKSEKSGVVSPDNKEEVTTTEIM
jgi:class 3 adenylate cyclase